MGDSVVPAISIQPPTPVCPAMSEASEARWPRCTASLACRTLRAIGAGNREQYCYSVCFEGDRDLGRCGQPGDRIYIDMWDDYLELIGH